MGFPEIMLGLHPGLGGTAHFTELVNPMQAMTMMLTGKTIDARKAKSLGLVDAVSARSATSAMPSRTPCSAAPATKPGPLNSLLNFGPVRGLLASRMRNEAEKAAPRETILRPMR